MAFHGTILAIDTMERLKDVQALEQTVWGMDPVPLHQTFTAAHNGGLVLGAYEDGRLVGSSYSFPGFSNGRMYLCSHMLAVHPDYRGKQVGRLLKQEQRRKAIALGYDLIVWTYDPLLSLNAYLNLHKLGGIAAAYEPNFYGEMDDRLNEGLPSDRFKIHWYLKAERQLERTHAEVTSDEILLDAKLAASSGLPTPLDSAAGRRMTEREGWFVAVPANFLSIKQHDFDLALHWRTTTNKVFSALFAAGFVATDLRKQPERAWHYYRFEKKADVLQRMGVK